MRFGQSCLGAPLTWKFSTNRSALAFPLRARSGAADAFFVAGSAPFAFRRAAPFEAIAARWWPSPLKDCPGRGCAPSLGGRRPSRRKELHAVAPGALGA